MSFGIVRSFPRRSRRAMMPRYIMRKLGKSPVLRQRRPWLRPFLMVPDYWARASARVNRKTKRGSGRCRPTSSQLNWL